MPRRRAHLRKPPVWARRKRSATRKRFSPALLQTFDSPEVDQVVRPAAATGTAPEGTEQVRSLPANRARLTGMRSAAHRRERRCPRIPTDTATANNSGVELRYGLQAREGSDNLPDKPIFC